MNHAQTNIERLRAIVRLFGDCNETFSAQFTIDELVSIYDAWKACGWDFSPQTWADFQIEDAIHGTVPRWDDDERPIDPNAIWHPPSAAEIEADGMNQAHRDALSAIAIAPAGSSESWAALARFARLPRASRANAVRDLLTPRGRSYTPPFPLCDGCGAPTGDDYATDAEVCGASDGPGFFLCDTCAALEGTPLEERRAHYTAQRAINRGGRS